MEENENQELDEAAAADVSDEAQDAGEAVQAADVTDEPTSEASAADALEQIAAAPSAEGGKHTAFMGVPIEVVISVGKARPLVSDLVNLRRDSVITLDSKIDDPVEIYIGDRLIARGELQEMENEEGQLGVRLTEVADLSNGV